MVVRLNKRRHIHRDRRGAQRIGDADIVDAHQLQQLARGGDIDLELHRVRAADLELAAQRRAWEHAWLPDRAADRAGRLFGRGDSSRRRRLPDRWLGDEQRILIEIQLVELIEPLAADRHKH